MFSFSSDRLIIKQKTVHVNLAETGGAESVVHEKFNYRSLEDVKKKAEELGIHLPFAKDTHVLSHPLRFGNVSINKRLGIAPMEGADSQEDGSPSELTRRRYIREAEGAAGTIWFEAISIVPEGRSSRHQLMITRENLDA